MISLRFAQVQLPEAADRLSSDQVLVKGGKVVPVKCSL